MPDVAEFELERVVRLSYEGDIFPLSCTFSLPHSAHSCSFSTHSFPHTLLLLLSISLSLQSSLSLSLYSSLPLFLSSSLYCPPFQFSLSSPSCFLYPLFRSGCMAFSLTSIPHFSLILSLPSFPSSLRKLPLLNLLWPARPTFLQRWYAFLASLGSVSHDFLNST